jgi:DNA (cytosine-5)-methyltransferase 1
MDRAGQVVAGALLEPAWSVSEGRQVNELALFAGAGGGILGGHLLGWRTVCAVERDAYAAQVLAQRQNDGTLRPFPIWSDVCSFDGKPWRGIVDVVSGGFPCQDISVSGTGAGLDGERSGLWRQMARIIREVDPRGILVENSPVLTSRGLGVVLADLASMGFDAEWGVFSGKAAGAPIERERIFIACTNQKHGKARVGNFERQAAVLRSHRNKRSPIWLQTPSKCFGVEHGMDSYVDQVGAIGNGQIPAVVATAWRMLGGC